MPTNIYDKKRLLIRCKFPILVAMVTRLSTLDMDSETTIAHLTQWLTNQELRIVRSFDLQSACASFSDRICPHHGDYPCDCQLVVLLVYSAAAAPVSIMLHTHRGKTDIDLVDSPNNHLCQLLEKTIRRWIEDNTDFPSMLNTETNAN